MEVTDIGKRIKMLRAFLGLNQTDFAEKIGSAQNTITGYESGRRNPSGQVIALICRTFGVNKEWLENGTGEMMQPKPADELDALAKRYDMNNLEYVVLEKYLNSPAGFRQQFCRLAMDVMAATADIDPTALSDGTPTDDDSSEDLHRLLDQELDAQKKVAGESTSSNSSDGSETRGAG